MNTNTIYLFWTGDNPMNEKRINCLNYSKETSKSNLILITKDTLHEYILKDHPLHPSYQYLSETHKSDYLRCYFAHFYGGGYMDVKKTLGPWDDCFEEMRNSNYLMCGYKHVGDGHVCDPYKPYWDELIATNAFICKPQSVITTEWYNEMILLMDNKLEQLQKNPAKYTDDSTWGDSGYPMAWSEMLGDIFFKITYKYKDKLLQTLPKVNLDLYDYRF